MFMVPSIDQNIIYTQQCRKAFGNVPCDRKTTARLRAVYGERPDDGMPARPQGLP